MKTLLSSADYCSVTRFDLERTAIFMRNWQFVGYTDDLNNPDDWITANIAGKLITVQNCAGQLKAFLNVCSHRYSQLRLAPKGNGQIQCPYHGWCYDHDGIPCAIPAKPRFDDLTPERIQSLALENFTVEACGKFVFVRLAKTGPDLRTFLGEAYNQLRKLAGALGKPIGQIKQNIQANWKLVLENTLEGYHVGFIHEKTFAKLGFAYPRMDYFGAHSLAESRVSDQVLNRWLNVGSRFAQRPFQNEGYLHFFIFPNFAVATLYGATFAVQSFRPVKPTQTELVVDMFVTTLDCELSETDKAILETIGASSLTYSRHVCEEDQAIVEKQQAGVLSRNQSGILSDEEQRIAHFQERYLACLCCDGKVKTTS